MHLARLLVVLSCATWLRIADAADACPDVAQADSRSVFDASRLKEGRFVYRTTLKGEFIGETVLEIRRAAPAWRITMSAPRIEQSWEATVDRWFSPLSAHLRMKKRTGPYEMSLAYSSDAVRGEERDADGARPVDAKLWGVVLDQRVDWAAMMALDVPASRDGSRRVSVAVFDPSTGVSRMLGEAAEASGARKLTGAPGEALSVPLAYRICKRDHVESYVVHATRDTPRYMLREDMPNGLVSELIRIEP